MKKINIPITIEMVNAILPQTQCTLCGYNGCKPYAEAIVHDHEEINRCPPGGVEGLLKLAELTHQDASPFIEEVKAKEKPKQVVKIIEEICIGCTKCIQACPVDAIVGASKQMHTVITDECTGCELCIEPCPVDCIDIVRLSSSNTITRGQSDHYRDRYEFRLARLEKEKKQEKKKYRSAKQAFSKNKVGSLEEKKKFIAEALLRVKAKKG